MREYFTKPLQHYAYVFPKLFPIHVSVNITWPSPPAQPNYTLPIVSTIDITTFTIDWTLIINARLVTKYFELTTEGGVTISGTGATFGDGSKGCTIAPKLPGCFGSMSTCADRGFSYVFTITFTSYKEDMYFISSGAELADKCGIAFFYRYGLFHYVVSTSTKVWYVSSVAASVNTTIDMVISWHRYTGVTVHMNGEVMASSWRYVTRKSAVTCQSQTSLYFGRSSFVTQMQYTGRFTIMYFTYYSASWVILDNRTGEVVFILLKFNNLIIFF